MQGGPRNILNKLYYNFFMYKTFIPKIFFVVVVLFVFIPRANAEVGLGISRYLFDLEVLPGQVHREELRVLNKSPNNPLPIHLQAVPWDLKEDSDDIEFITAEPALNAASWFRFKEVGTETVLRNFILDPGKEKKIAVEIEPPSTRLGSSAVRGCLILKEPAFVLSEQQYDAQIKSE